MTVAYTGDKGEPEVIPAGSPATFAADVTEVAGWFQKGRSFRRAADMSALGAATGMEDHDLCLVDTIRGAWFEYNGTAAAWSMHGVAQFADASARDAAITSPAAGMRARAGGIEWIRGGSAWVPAFAAGIYGRRPRSSATPSISNSTYTDLSTDANWGTESSLGFSTYSNGWTIPVSGVYRVGYSFTSQSNIALLAGVTVNKSTSVGYADLKCAATAPAVGTIVSISASDEIALSASDVVRLFALAASGAPTLLASIGDFYLEWIRP